MFDNFTTRRKVLKALRDPEVQKLMAEDPQFDQFFDTDGLNVAAPTGLSKIRWLFGADLSEGRHD